MDLNKLFRPKKLAIIGGYWADFVYDENIKIGFKGKIWHINPKRRTTKKKKYYKSLADLPSIPDCVYIAVSNDLTIKLMKDVSDMGGRLLNCKIQSMKMSHFLEEVFLNLYLAQSITT